MNKLLLKTFSAVLLLLSLALIGAFHPNVVKCATQFKGVINSDTKWTKANSPYNLTGNVLVAKTATLTIEPGVTVNLNRFYIMINGTLIAKGTPSQPISMSNGVINVTEYANGWEEGSSLGSQFENLLLTSVEISSAVPLKISSVKTDADITLPDLSKIENSTIAASVSLGPSSMVVGNSISGKLTINSFSIRISSGGSEDGEVESTVRDISSIIENFINGSITARDSVKIFRNVIYGYVQTESVQLVNNGITGVIYILMQKEQTSLIASNVIRGGGDTYTERFAGYYKYASPRSALYVGGGQCEIFNNTFICQSVTQLLGEYLAKSDGGGYGITTRADNVARIFNNSITGFTLGINAIGSATIESNIIANNTSGIAIGQRYEDREFWRGSKVIRNNLITSITGAGIKSYAINIFYSESSTSEISGEPNVKIEHNIIVGCMGIDLAEHTILIQNNTIYTCLTAIRLAGRVSAAIAFNDIHVTSQYCLYLDAVARDVNATYNWWGTNDVESINRLIYDYNDDFTLGRVTFTPLLSEPNFDVDLPIILSLAQTSGSLAFVVEQTGTLAGSIEPYGCISVNYGESKTFTIRHSERHHIVDVLVNGSSVGPVSSYTVVNITGPTFILAIFEVNQNSIDSGSSTPTPTSTASVITPRPSEAISPTQEPETGSFLPMETVYAIIAVAVVVLIVAGLAVVIKKRKR